MHTGVYCQCNRRIAVPVSRRNPKSGDAMHLVLILLVSSPLGASSSVISAVEGASTNVNGAVQVPLASLEAS